RHSGGEDRPGHARPAGAVEPALAALRRARTGPRRPAVAAPGGLVLVAAAHSGARGLSRLARPRSPRLRRRRADEGGTRRRPGLTPRVRAPNPWRRLVRRLPRLSEQ